ncbi:TonB-dependent receptor [Jiella avicenniae]|uniref:TonB-dependent receptor n=1 Tax=Jiella avicenniae TaxID=2907202 RepID=A0A9X1P2B3_9HYPH|nr:TonB-dependent receptor [Jiella avicenniae]MCE7029228.1 TonB-dependent receptor [Jiella avicenniae]
MRSRRLLRLQGGVSAVSISAALMFGAHAQDATPGETLPIELDTVVITGENFTRSLASTSSSVSVLTEDEIDQKVEAATVDEAIVNLPNVVIPAEYGQGSAPSIRGQDSEGPNSGASAFFGGTTPRATVSLDGHNLSYYELVYSSTPIWDVESIEVFRGPQTINQGANSIAGAIVINTKDPVFEREAAAQVEYSSLETRRGSMMLNSPLLQDMAARVAIDYYARDNFIDYTNPAFASSGDQDLETRNARAKLLFRPSEIPGLEAKLTYQHIGSDRPTWEAATEPFEDRDSETLTNPTWDQSTNTVIGDITYDFGNELVFTNQIQYSDLETSRLTEPLNGGSADITSQDFSNESRLTFGTEDSAWSGVAGVYYRNTEESDTLYLSDRTSVPTYVSEFDDQRNSLGVFAEVNYRFWDRWVLTGGLRYQRDELQRNGYAELASRIPGASVTTPIDYDESFDALLPKLSLAYEVTEDVTVGGLISRGYNPGGVTLNLVTNTFVPYDKEMAWNYELFTRANLIDDTLSVNANVFYTDLTDAQRYLVSDIDPFFAQTVNVDDAHSYGMEFGAEYKPLDYLTLNGSVGLLKTEIDTVTDPAAASLQGKEFGRAPDYTLAFGARWDVLDNLALTADVRHTDGYFSDDVNDRAAFVDSFTVANAKIQFKPREEVEMFGYVKNIFDEEGPTFLRYSRTILGYEGPVVPPREFGGGLKVSF